MGSPWAADASRNIHLLWSRLCKLKKKRTGRRNRKVNGSGKEKESKENAFI